MALRSRWTTHHDPQNGDAFCHNEETGETMWGDPARHWEPRVGGAMRNVLTKEIVTYDGVEGNFFGSWHACNIRRENDDGTVDVVWKSDGTGTSGMLPTDIRNRRLAAQARKGAQWREHVCFTHARAFYTHCVSNVTKWQVPEEFLVWKRYVQSWRLREMDGQPVYYNLTTGEMSATSPPGWYRYLDCRAEARFHGAWYACTVWRQRVDGSYDVRWHDGTGSTSLSPADVRMIDAQKDSYEDYTPVHREYDASWAALLQQMAEERFRLLNVTRCVAMKHTRGPKKPIDFVLDANPPKLPSITPKRKPLKTRSADYWLKGFINQC